MSKAVTARGIQFSWQIITHFLELERKLESGITPLAADHDEKDNIVRDLKLECSSLFSRVSQEFEAIWKDIRKERPLSNAGTAKAIQDTKSSITHEINRMLQQSPLSMEYYSPMQEDTRRIVDQQMETLKAKLGVKDV